MDKKPVLSACAAPWLPPPEDGVMGRRWKQDFEEGVIHPFLPQRRRRGIRAEALDTARDVKTHPYSSFTIMHLTPLKGISEGDFYTLFDFAMSAAFRNWPRFFLTSLLLLLIFASHKKATKAGIIRCFVLKKNMPPFESLVFWLFWGWKHTSYWGYWGGAGLLPWVLAQAHSWATLRNETTPGDTGYRSLFHWRWS